MKIDLHEVKTQDETKEPAAIDQANERVEAKLKVIEEETRERVSEGLQEVKDRKHASKTKSK
jgi:hypothetical protein